MDRAANVYQPLTLTTLEPGTGFAGPYFANPNLVKVSAYALEVMTDLRFVPAASVRPGVGLEMASHQMIARGVRLLLVANDDGQVVGLITARDLVGDRPAEVMARENLPFVGLTVGHVMTPTPQIEALLLDEVLHARVGDIIATLRNSGRQHALVVENDPYSGQPAVRGIFSASQIARQLGFSALGQELSQTFADLEQAILAEE